MAGDNKLVAFDLPTGKARQVVRQTRGCWHLKISPDGKYLMGRGDLERGGKGLWIVQQRRPGVSRDSRSRADPRFVSLPSVAEEDHVLVRGPLP